MFKMNKKGFTLVELMVVLAILGLLAAIGIPQYMKTLANSKEATDLGNITRLQSAVDAFSAETGKPLAGQILGPHKSPITYTTELDSILTGQKIKFADFWTGDLPELKSDRGLNGPSGTSNGGYWYVNGNGRVVVSNSTGATIALPR